jgi:hypothetical protein
MPKSSPRIHVLVVVDVEAAAGDQALADTIWMPDNGPCSDAPVDGRELVTRLSPGDRITWSLAAMNGGDRVAFAVDAFAGPAVPTVIDPQRDRRERYAAVFNVPPESEPGQRFRYTLTLEIEGRSRSFDAFLCLR